MSGELKSCPFCGSAADLSPDRITDERYDITCWNCHAGTGGDISYGPEALGRDQAAAAWNTRASDAHIERIEALNAELREALRPFVEGYAHTSRFLCSREKMHPAGQDLYAEEIWRARAALSKSSPARGEGEGSHG